MNRVALVFVLVVVGCTGGPGPIDSSSGSSSGGSSSGGSSSGGSSSGGSSSGSSGGTSQTISASEFSQSCVDDTDCTAIYEGAICSPCGCPNAAIARTALSDYSAKREAADCPDTGVACEACAAPAVSCAQGTCTITR